MLSVVPQQRRLLYDLFTKHHRLRRSVVQTRLAQEFGEVSKAEVDRLLHVSSALTGVQLPVCVCDAACRRRSAAAATPGCGT